MPTHTASHTRAPLGQTLACGVAIAVQTWQTWLLNNGIFPVTSLVFPLAREIQTLAGILAGVAVLAAAMRAPHLLRPRPLLAASLVCCTCGTLTAALAPASAALVTIGLSLLAASGALGFLLLGLALAGLAGSRAMAPAIVAGVLASSLLSACMPAPGLTWSLALNALAECATLALLWPIAAAQLKQLAQGPGTEVQSLANPRSFLSPSHQVFVLMFVFSLAFGFALSLGIAEFTPVSSWLRLVLLACVGAWFVLARGDREDALFVASSVLVVAGFLLAPLGSGLVGAGTANSLLYAGNSCFKVLSYSAMSALCSRNPAGSLVVLACGDIAGSAGTFVGADLGHLCNALLDAQPAAASLMTGAAVLALFAYALTGLRGFSFAQTIRGVEPATPPSTPDSASIPSREELLDAACDALAVQGGLTSREREVLGMLARGHNGYHIRDELTLSYNTVKTHVKRVYRKLDVHSQQELIDLAGAAVREGGAPGRG